MTGDAATTSDGVLTSVPSATFRKTSGNLVITSLHAVIDDSLPSYASIQLWGDVENRGTVLECFPLSTLAIDGYDILTIVQGPTYEVTSGVIGSCLPPRARGVIYGIDNQVSATLLDGYNAVTYAVEGVTPTGAVPHPALPRVTELSVTPGPCAVTGTLVGRSEPISDVVLDFYVRDSSGLLRDVVRAFPGDFETILPGSRTSFKTGESEAFSRYEYFIDFDEGAQMQLVNPREREIAERKRQVQQRVGDAASARKSIRRRYP